MRNPFLELVEKHFLKLDALSLRPALKAIILSLLPGLEEENTEEFERTLKLLDSFRGAVRPEEVEDLGGRHSTGDEYFWQCFFLASITNKGRRQGALTYLTRNLPKLGQPLPQEEHLTTRNGSHKGNGSFDPNQARLAAMVTSPEPGLLLRCFAAGLADQDLLIQRGFLDLLVTHLPLDSDVLQHRVKGEDLELLMTAAAGVVTRKEVSLNRRLWAWLLGPEPAGHDGDNAPSSPTSVAASEDPFNGQHVSRTQYFETLGLTPLTRALLSLIQRNSLSPVERARPFRICLSLMDKEDIGGFVVPELFLPVINSARTYKEKAATKADFSEVLRSAGQFFNGFNSGLIWGEVFRLIAQATSLGSASEAERLDKLTLVNFIISHFNVSHEDLRVGGFAE